MAAGTHSEGHGNNDPQMGGHSQSLGHGHDSNETGGHDDAMMAVGVPGDAAEVKRTIEVTMRETADGDMIFEPSSIEIHKNETIRFVVANAGDLTHEFVLDNHDGVIEHKALMERFPEMEHDDPNSVRLESGQSSELFWHFTNAGSFEFACLIPGHYAAGMKGDIAVSDQVASN
ncbi:MAG: cupredoxin family protein [Rhizobiales bacterium]|nr:cupredoxin family protein [Hyphomicrobiales bacterium]